jgi:hypothetical protein
MSHPSLTPAQCERLVKLMEECAEVQKECAKILIHGYDDVKPGTSLTNRQKLEMELGDVHSAMKLLTTARDLQSGMILTYAINKDDVIKNHMHHQG